MIAAGLCLMGGCFAQDADTSLVDSYWPAEKVEIPASASLLVFYKYDSVPAGVNFEDCYFYTRQIVKSGTVGFFAVVQNTIACISSYYHTNKHLMLEYASASGAKDMRRYMPDPYPLDAEFKRNSWGGEFVDLGLSNTESTPVIWDPLTPGGILRLLESRQGDKDFYVSFGKWGYKWYLLPMKSSSQNIAVFDVEADTLVEI